MEQGIMPLFLPLLLIHISNIHMVQTPLLSSTFMLMVLTLPYNNTLLLLTLLQGTLMLLTLLHKVPLFLMGVLMGMAMGLLMIMVRVRSPRAVSLGLVLVWLWEPWQGFWVAWLLLRGQSMWRI